jgi:hypothetical protein
LVPDHTVAGQPPGFIAWDEQWLDDWLVASAIDQWAGT